MGKGCLGTNGRKNTKADGTRIQADPTTMSPTAVTLALADTSLRTHNHLLVEAMAAMAALLRACMGEADMVVQVRQTSLCWMSVLIVPPGYGGPPPGQYGEGEHHRHHHHRQEGW
jgi:hypothetical protein